MMWRVILAISSLVTVCSGSALPQLEEPLPVNASGPGPLPDQYIPYEGDGSSWPSNSSWETFENMWTSNSATIGTNCVGGVAPNTATETGQIYDALEAAAEVSGVDNRILLAVVLQESNGCVRIGTTTWSVPNPGLMQSHNGIGTCNLNGTLTNPCPAEAIFQMIQDGAYGTETGDGIFRLMDKTTGTGTQAVYQAVRMYNSGANSIPASGDLGGTGSTPCYASDVANRLMGWVKAPSTCTSAT